MGMPYIVAQSMGVCEDQTHAVQDFVNNQVKKLMIFSYG